MKTRFRSCTDSLAFHAYTVSQQKRLRDCIDIQSQSQPSNVSQTVKRSDLELL